ncbi:MAG: DNA polymerase III subunit delta [Anaerolineales bacterium]|jgi:DNA polymerase-3 subunit delta
MSEAVPVVYLLHGEDDFAIADFIRSMIDKMGDPSMAEMNTTRFSDGNFSLESLQAAASAVPFLSARRLVIVENVSRRLSHKAEQERFTTLLEQLPETTALVLAESKTLSNKHWLMKWAQSAGSRAYVRLFGTPKGSQMASWIRKYAADHGGEISPQAAAFLAESVQESPRMAALEVEKLLAYVNYSRPVELDDVEMAAAFVGGQGDYFTLLDSIAARNGSKAMEMLQKLFEEQDALPLFFGLVNHFRLVLQAREIYENGGREETVAKTLAIHPYRAKKITMQARSLSMNAWEQIYLRLQQLDTEIKTGQISGELALETLVLELAGG